MSVNMSLQSNSGVLSLSYNIILLYKTSFLYKFTQTKMYNVHSIYFYIIDRNEKKKKMCKKIVIYHTSGLILFFIDFKFSKNQSQRFLVI